EAALALVQTWTVQHGLRLHPEKTRIVDSSQGGDGFDFLGYRFAGGRRHVRPKSLKGLRDKIRQHTGRTRSGSLAQIIAELNGSVTDSCAITPWRKGAHASRAIVRKALVGKHRTNHIDIQ